MLTEHVHDHITNPEYLHEVRRHSSRFEERWNSVHELRFFFFFLQFNLNLQNHFLRRKWNEMQQNMDELKLSDFLLSISVPVAEAVNFRLCRDEYSCLWPLDMCSTTVYCV